MTRKWRLPWILVQLMKLLMLLESTVCLSSAPVPSHTKGMTKTITSDYWDIILVEEVKNRICIHFNLLGKVRCRAHTSSDLLSPPPSCLTDRRSRRSYHPPQNELWGGGKKEKHRKYVLLYTCRGANKIKWFPDPTQHLKTSVSWLELLYLSHVVFSFWLCYIFCLTV